MPGFLTQQTNVSPIAITDTVVVNSEAEMLALQNVSVGDIAIRTDVYKSFILKNSDQSLIGSWQEILSPTSQYRGVAQSGDPLTLVYEDSGKLRAMTNPSPSDTTVTVSSQANVPWTEGTRISIVRLGTGGVTIVGETGVTINSLNGLTISGQYGFVDLYRIQQDLWIATGDLTV